MMLLMGSPMVGGTDAGKVGDDPAGDRVRATPGSGAVQRGEVLLLGRPPYSWTCWPATPSAFPAAAGRADSGAEYARRL